MSMQDLDKQILYDMMRDHGFKDVIRALRDVISERADELVDDELKDEAKPFTLAAHHLSIFVDE